MKVSSAGHRSPALSPVGSRPGAPVGRSISTVPRLQPPPRRTQRADFPHCAPPFASCRGLWDLSCRGYFRPVASHSIAVKQLQGVVQPWPTPSLPAEAPSFLSMRQVAPDLLLHPILDVAEALTGVPDCEVVHPPPQHWIDQVYHPLNRLRSGSAEYFLELAHQCRPLFELGRIMRPHRPA